jgi:hypothetical protein
VHNFKIINNIRYAILCSECAVNVTSNELYFHSVISNIFSDITKQRLHSFPGLELCSTYYSCIKYYILWSLKSVVRLRSQSYGSLCVGRSSERSGVSLDSWRNKYAASAGCLSKNMVCVLSSVQFMIFIPFNALSDAHFHALDAILCPWLKVHL